MRPSPRAASAKLSNVAPKPLGRKVPTLVTEAPLTSRASRHEPSIAQKNVPKASHVTTSHTAGNASRATGANKRIVLCAPSRPRRFATATNGTRNARKTDRVSAVGSARGTTKVLTADSTVPVRTTKATTAAATRTTVIAARLS